MEVNSDAYLKWILPSEKKETVCLALILALQVAKQEWGNGAPQDIRFLWGASRRECLACYRAGLA